MFRRILSNAKNYAAFAKNLAANEAMPVVIKNARVPLAMFVMASMEPAVTMRDASVQTDNIYDTELSQKNNGLVMLVSHNVNVPKLLEDADQFFREGKFLECVELLQNFKMFDDPEIHWRLARSLYNLTKQTQVSKEKKKNCILDGFDLMKNALEKWPNHGAIHKWYAVLLDSFAGLQGVKERVRQCKTVKEHMMRATELNPSDATAWYMLGEWCYHVADISWHERKIAVVLFGEPPYSTFEEALRCFQKAEETEPLFYSYNLLMLGKTYYRLGKTEPALFYLQKAQLHPKSCDDDMIAYNEATKLLYKLKRRSE